MWCRAVLGVARGPLCRWLAGWALSCYASSWVPLCAAGLLWWCCCCAVKLHHARPRQRGVGLLAPSTWAPFPPQTGKVIPHGTIGREYSTHSRKDKKKKGARGNLAGGPRSGKGKMLGLGVSICEWNNKRNTSARQPISRLRRASSCSRDANEDVPTHTCRTDG